MSELPQPPPGVQPGDFAPIGTPVGPGAPLAQPPKTNGWAIASLISGLLGCVPYVMGAVAVITGIIGLKNSRDPRYSGRSMAIGGIVLGSLSIVFWLFFAGAVWSFVSATRVQRQMAQDFVQMVSTGAVEAASEKVTGNVTRNELEALSRQMQEWGTYQDLTSSSSSLSYDNGVTTTHLEGTATFANGEHPFAMTLVKEGEVWKVSSLRFD
jgi:hypothetical protein